MVLRGAHGVSAHKIVCKIMSIVLCDLCIYFAVLGPRCMTVSRHCALVTLNYGCRFLENVGSFNMENVFLRKRQTKCLWYDTYRVTVFTEKP